ncbi:helix-turn-helix domain-containing protein [Streptomyces sp. B93]|uniref:helix-turn-helix domain-containing protein n=1 Tax=Streptomyces sp. B93 TaxID=2824875 RepID=UPI001B380553|nr:RICIN domain-containing protein [Streptomyces sp. B93]MBQ1090556.1 RICIN domain-containing protein [Streptomyces sp. B93]
MTEPGRGDHVSAARRLGGALRGLQQRSGRTLRALEEQVNISDSSLSRYFRGDTVPPWPVVRDLCRALGADPSEYRALWEAAGRGRSEPSPDAAAWEAPRSRARHRRLRAALTGRWGVAVAGTLTGLLAGLLLASLVRHSPSPAPADRPVQGVAPKARGGQPGDVSASLPKPSDEQRIFVSRATGNCLDDSLDQDLRAYRCNGMSYQRWTVRSSADGTRQLRNHATGRCLADGGTGPHALPCDRSAAQKWTLLAHEDEAVGLRNQTTGRCLDDSTMGLRARPCAATHHQKWA